MSRVFETPRDGLKYDVYGGAVPNSMLYRIKQIEGLSKQTLSIVPTSGQGSVYNENKIIVSLPMNSFLDIGTFEANSHEKTAHNGAEHKKLCSNSISPPKYPIFHFKFRT
jgi:hypothetical protein